MKYNSQTNKKIFEFWKENNFFKDQNKGNKTFRIIMPPPNVTGQLHLGHAWDAYYPDLLIRYKMMNGYDVTWYPGFDHAGIATQSKVEKVIFEETGVTRNVLGKELFLKEVWNYKEKSQSRIQEQWEALGIIPDYDKAKFTLDKDVSELVTKSFIDLYNQGLIYKGTKMVNWDSQLETVISDIEVEHRDVSGKLYYVKYFLKDSDEYLVVATTRPETIFGDTNLFVNPDDKRFVKYVGKFAVNPLTGKELKILTDEYVSMEFGTGVMKVTPAHDFNDYLLGQKHNLNSINVYNTDGTFNENVSKKYIGKDRLISRKDIVKDLDNRGNIDAINDHKMSVGYSERSGVIVEPRISTQWFLKSSELAKLALKNQDSDTSIDFYPKQFNDVFVKWISNFDDWCISRQLWWGHQLPVWYKADEIKVQTDNPGEGWVQDKDVLDTWFSSSLWPIVYEDDEKISKSDNPKYLSDVLFTGYDIILFWVSKMVFMSLKLDKDHRAPFKKAIIHGLVRDANNKKMSKSLGNGVEPLEIVKQYGSDSLRIFLMGNSTPGQDIKFNLKKINHAWGVQNKISNVLNFIKMLDLFKDSNSKIEEPTVFTPLDKYITLEFNNLLNEINKNIEIYNLAVIYDLIDDFIFNKFSSVYLELVKFSMNKNQQNNFIYIYSKLLILLHPFMPFVTEEIYQDFKFNNFCFVNKSILQESYVSKFEEFNNDKLNLEIDNIYKSIRNSGRGKGDILNIYLKTQNATVLNAIFEKLNVNIIDDSPFIHNIISLDSFFNLGFIGIDLATNDQDLISKDKLIEKADKFLKNEISRSEKIISNFIKHDSEAENNFIINEKQKLEFNKEYLDELNRYLNEK